MGERVVSSVEVVLQNKSVYEYVTYLRGQDQWIIKKAHDLGQWGLRSRPTFRS